ncbi:MAG: ribonuclease J [Thermomicrobiales bacterium]
MAKRRRLRVIPLGGVDEIGKNSNLIEYGTNLILIDAGVKFPEEDQRGVDLVIPDYTYLREHRDQLRGILITHGHEDHIGGLPYLLPQIATPSRPIPIYGSDLALGFIEAKLRERRATQYADLLSIEPGNRYPLGQQIDAEFVPVSHSIPGSMAVVLHLPDGKVIATGDFKMDPTPTTGPPTDERRLRQLGAEGVLLLISDTTRAEVPGHTPSEQVVRETLERIVTEAPGRVIITTFASNITRLQHAITTAHVNGRKVAVVGRSMENNTRVAVELGYLQVPMGTIIPVDQAIKLSPKQVMLITTGSQGEPSSALTRIAAGEHQKIRIRQGDTVVLAASPIPGNDLTVARTIDNLFRAGADVIYSALVPSIHVSGHGARDELRRMIELTRPKYILPVHGEYRMLVQYQKLAAEAGIPPERVPIATIGDIWQFDEQGARKLGQVPAGSVLIDGLTVGNVTTEVLRDRQHLAEDGVIFAALVVDRATGELLNGPELVARGFVHSEGDALLESAADEVRRTLRRRGGHGSAEIGRLVERTSQVLGAYIYRQTHQRPMILPVVTEV